FLPGTITPCRRADGVRVPTLLQLPNAEVVIGAEERLELGAVGSGAAVEARIAMARIAPSVRRIRGRVLPPPSVRPAGRASSGFGRSFRPVGRADSLHVSVCICPYPPRRGSIDAGAHSGGGHKRFPELASTGFCETDH